MSFTLHLPVSTSGVWAVGVEALQLSAEEDTDLEIQCTHTYAQGNIKYFCKVPCTDRDVLISSKQKEKNSRYSIRDTGNTFYVTISGLTQADTGKYWCGVERVAKDTYSQVYITVTPKKVVHWPPNASLQNESLDKLLYIGVGLGALLCILFIVVTIFIKHRHRNIPKAFAGDNVPMKAVHHSCIIQDPSDIYVNVETHENYSSVHFSKRRADSVAHTEPDLSVYSLVRT
ncbi:unnamed protein product [Knipowitschia caucasica]|uniref:Immunoglobulin domain-containing protein n=1 Tax=Knipowitschia caucasica TaxID=637954 RepID=A0AAV2LII0_KNICA